MNNIIDGKALSNEILEQLKNEIESNKLSPKLAIVKVGDDAASSVYVKNKLIAAEKIGVEADLIQLSEETSQSELENRIALLNESDIDGYIIQLPLPKHIDESKIINLIDPNKDIDGFGQNIAGAIMQNNAKIFPCTPLGIVEMIKKYEIDVAGKNAVVIGRSNIVGKPIGMMLLNMNATVTFTHSKTKDIDSILRNADIIVSAVGQPGIVNEKNIKNGVIIFDVGINRDENNKLTGDVDFANVQPIAKLITPVPGGVGPMTVAMLMKNLINTTKKV